MMAGWNRSWFMPNRWWSICGTGELPATAPVFFMDKEEALALEIGPTNTKFVAHRGGSFLFPNMPGSMEVRYNGRPMPGVDMTITIDGTGWQRRMKTDGKGQFMFVPLGFITPMRHYGKILFTATYRDPKEQTVHIATLSMLLFERGRGGGNLISKEAGYNFWAMVSIAGVFLFIVLRVFFVHREKSRALNSFDKLRIKED